MARPQESARTQTVYITYEFKCSAAHHAARSAEPGWYDGILATQKAPAPPAPAPTLTVYCSACAAAVDAGEEP